MPGRIDAQVERSPAPLKAVLDRVRLDGAIFFRAELTEAWAFLSRPREYASALRPGTKRLILFHIVARGKCWVSVDDQERHWADTGDVIVLPYGDQHDLGGVEDAEIVPILTLLPPLPWASIPNLRHGGQGPPTDIVCGYLHSPDPLFDPNLRALPPVFVVSPPEGPAAHWVQASINYALASVSESPAPDPSATRLPELVLIEVLRLHLATAPAIEQGWIAALSDPVLAPAMAILHAAPDKKWTVASLAATSAVSRSLLDERFRQMLGRSPIRYLTEWRMHVAQDLLATTNQGMAAIARRVGYDSEEAFSRAFKRSYGSSPSVWRAERLPSRMQ